MSRYLESGPIRFQYLELSLFIQGFKEKFVEVNKSVETGVPARGRLDDYQFWLQINRVFFELASQVTKIAK